MKINVEIPESLRNQLIELYGQEKANELIYRYGYNYYRLTFIVLYKKIIKRIKSII